MNIFALNKDPIVSAKLQCDKHVVKIPLETAQMLCSAFEIGIPPYKRTHYNQPSTVWSRQSRQNFEWLVIHGLALCDEYQYRYGKVHKCKTVIEWCLDNIHLIKFDNNLLTDIPKCMPDDCKLNDVVESYRNFYRIHKRDFAKWTKREVPSWF